MKDHKMKIIIVCVVLLLIAPIDSVSLIHNVLLALTSLIQGLHLK